MGLVTEEIQEWFRKEQTTIDEVMAEAAVRFLADHEAQPNFAYDLRAVQEELYLLSKGKDVCYDRMCTGFCYSSWYQARRMNTSLVPLLEAMLNCRSDQVDIVDLGAGTGAIQCTLGWILAAANSLNFKVPDVRIRNVDSSPIMLRYCEDYIWPALTARYKVLEDSPVQIVPEYHLNSWRCLWQDSSVESLTRWITASYLLDYTDQKESVVEDFQEIVLSLAPEKMILTTSGQRKKKSLLERLSRQLSSEYSETTSSDPVLVDKKLSALGKLRSSLLKKYEAKGARAHPGWCQDFNSLSVLTRLGQSEMNFTTKSPLSSSFSHSPEIDRGQIKLSDEQEKAASFSGPSSAIIGPAGSGKTIVITEKIARAVRNWDKPEPLDILVTSFNKPLIDLIANWTEQLLGDLPVTALGCEGAHKISCGVATVRLLGFDKLPTKLGRMSGGIESSSAQKLSAIAQNVLAKSGSTRAAMKKLADAEFLEEEFHRIFYGLSVQSFPDYIGVDRKGRGARLGPKQRGFVFDVIKDYLLYLKKRNVDTFISRRRKYLSKLEAGEVREQFDIILLDEFQDLTNADFKILDCLFKPGRRDMTIAGDLAQAVHLGKTAGIPGAQKGHRRHRYHLRASYRLPHRVCLALKPLSTGLKQQWENDEGCPMLAPVKRAPPGPRPIIIAASNRSRLADKISEVWNVYGIYDLSEITILEQDIGLYKALKAKGIEVRTDSILRLKGLEKRCIVWSTSADVNTDEVLEFVYTILTRTSSVLILTLLDDSIDKYRSVLSLLKSENLIFWDQDSEAAFSSFVAEEKSK